MKILKLLIYLLLLLPLPSLAQSVVSHPTLGDDLIAYFEFDEVSGSREASNDTITLNDNNSVLSTTSVLNLGAVFDIDTLEFLSATDASAPQFGITGDFSSCVFFVRGNTQTLDQTFVSRYDTYPTSFNYWFFLRSDDKLQFYWRKTSTDYFEISSVAISNTDVYNSACVTYNSSTGDVKFYNNGSQLGSTQGSSGFGINDNAPSFRVGKTTTGNSDFFDGIMDNLLVSARVLTDQEISDYHNNGSGLCYDCSESTATSSTSVIIPVYTPLMPLLESVVTDTATYTLNYASTTVTYPTPLTLFIFYVVAVVSLCLGAYVSYRFL